VAVVARRSWWEEVRIVDQSPQHVETVFYRGPGSKRFRSSRRALDEDVRLIDIEPGIIGVFRTTLWVERPVGDRSVIPDIETSTR